MKNKFVYIASGFCVVALGYVQFSDNDQEANHSNPNSTSLLQQTALSDDQSQATTNSRLQQQLTQMTASSNNNSARFIHTSTDNDALYRSVEAKYARVIDEPNRYNRQSIDIESMTQDQRVSLSNNPRAIVLKHRAFIVGEDYRGDDGALYLISEKPLTKPQFDKLEGLGIIATDKIHSTVWIAEYNNVNAIDNALQQDFILGTGRVSPLDKISPSTLVDIDLSKVKETKVMISLSKADQLNEFIQENPAAKIDVSSVIYDQTLLAATIPNNLIINTASSSLVEWIEDSPPTIEMTNTQAATVSGVDKVDMGPAQNFPGLGVNIGVWDDGPIGNHNEFIVNNNFPYYENRETDQPIGFHATHVTGTIKAMGYDKKARGMAPYSKVYGYDLSKMNGIEKVSDGPWDIIIELLNSGLPITNHSWAYTSGWTYNQNGDSEQSCIDKQKSDPKEVCIPRQFYTKDVFGDYSSVSGNYDAIIRIKDMLFIKSAGNDRNKYNCNPSDSTDCDGDENGYKTISLLGSAKNTITVGAVEDNGTKVTDYSGFGPTDDGRIKPDITANGDTLYSTHFNSKTNKLDYKVISGTSMATPVVTGSTALMMQAYKVKFKNTPRAATLKALMIHTAKDIGNKGPDYQTGWGVLQTDRAVALINSGSSYVVEGGALFTRNVNLYSTQVNSSKPLKITINWTDAPGTPNASKALVNNIDLFLKSPSGKWHYPWKLDPNNPSKPATQSFNSTDNVEQIVVDQPESGKWEVYVLGESTNKDGQNYSMVSSYPRNAEMQNYYQ